MLHLRGHPIPDCPHGLTLPRGERLAHALARDHLIHVLTSRHEAPENELFHLNGKLLGGEKPRRIVLLRQAGDDGVVHPLPLAQEAKPAKEEAVRRNDEVLGVFLPEDLRNVAVVFHQGVRIGEKEHPHARLEIQLGLTGVPDFFQRVQKDDGLSRSGPAADEEVEPRPEAIHRFRLLGSELHDAALIVHAGARVQGEAAHVVHVQVQVAVGGKLLHQSALLPGKIVQLLSKLIQPFRLCIRPGLFPVQPRCQAERLPFQLGQAQLVLCPRLRAGKELCGIALRDRQLHLDAGKLFALPQRRALVVPQGERPAQLLQPLRADTAEAAESKEIVGCRERLFPVQPGEGMPDGVCERMFLDDPRKSPEILRTAAL